MSVTEITMLVYKYKPVSQLQHVVDILINHRLYCAPIAELNDLHEALFEQPVDQDDHIAQLAHQAAIDENLRQLRVCSLTCTPDNPLLWAYYAEGFSGVVIEIDLPDRDLSRVEYSSGATKLPRQPTIGAEKDARAAAVNKLGHWQHEKEWRILSSEQYYRFDSSKLLRVVIGPRTPEVVVETLRLICEKKDIKIEQILLHPSGSMYLPYWKFV
jgi:hypothetical protein